MHKPQPNTSTGVLRAVILAGLKGKYDQHHELLRRSQQVNKLDEHKDDAPSSVTETHSAVNTSKATTKASALRRRAPKLALAALALLLFVYLVNNLHQQLIERHQAQVTAQNQKKVSQVLGTESQKESLGSPVRLKIPKIHVDAAVEYVGLAPDGTMEVPNDTVDVGWFDLGPRPGEKGSAVIAGHFNGSHGETGVFSDLDKLKAGDTLYVQDDQGKSLTFVVRGSRVYTPGYADDVFGSGDGTHLNLITCEGSWDAVNKSYSKRLVVFTDREE